MTEPADQSLEARAHRELRLAMRAAYDAARVAADAAAAANKPALARYLDREADHFAHRLERL